MQLCWLPIYTGQYTELVIDTFSNVLDSLGTVYSVFIDVTYVVQYISMVTLTDIPCPTVHELLYAHNYTSITVDRYSS